MMGKRKRIMWQAFLSFSLWKNEKKANNKLKVDLFKVKILIHSNKNETSLRRTLRGVRAIYCDDTLFQTLSTVFSVKKHYTKKMLITINSVHIMEHPMEKFNLISVFSVFQLNIR